MTEPTLSFGNQREGASRYLGALREHWVLIVALVVIAVGSAAAYSYTAAKKYKAESDLLVSPQSDSAFDGLPVIRESNGLTSGVLTAARLIQTPQVAERVRTRHAFGMSRDALLGSISVQPLSQSNIIAIDATAGSPSALGRHRQRLRPRVREPALRRLQRGADDDDGAAAGLESRACRPASSTRLLPPICARSSRSCRPSPAVPTRRCRSPRRQSSRAARRGRARS